MRGCHDTEHARRYTNGSPGTSACGRADKSDDLSKNCIKTHYLSLRLDYSWRPQRRERGALQGRHKPFEGRDARGGLGRSQCIRDGDGLLLVLLAPSPNLICEFPFPPRLPFSLYPSSSPAYAVFARYIFCCELFWCMQMEFSCSRSRTRFVSSNCKEVCWYEIYAAFTTFLLCRSSSVNRRQSSSPSRFAFSISAHFFVVVFNSI